jgi:MarR family transcriptional regulator, organic hydroperoxide resistance regulator
MPDERIERVALFSGKFLMADEFGSLDPLNTEFKMASWPFYWITRVARRYSHDLEDTLKKIGMDVARWRVLMILNEINPASVSELADHAVIKLSTMTKTVIRMQVDGLVTTSSRKSDARVTEVSLTDAGRTAISSVRRQASRVFLKAFQDFDSKEIEQLNETLKRVFANLEDFPD